VDAHRLDPVGQHHARHILDILEKFLEPALEMETVPQHEIGLLRFDDVARGWLIVVDLGARLGDRHDGGFVAGDVLGDVLNHGEGGHDLEGTAGFFGGGLRCRTCHR
jgi:hypothetical protein